MIGGASSCAQSFIRRAGMRSGPSDFLLLVCFRRRLTSGTETYLKWKVLAAFIDRTLDLDQIKSHNQNEFAFRLFTAL